ncbi:MAG: ElyC/SanA/YdcF family protein [Candidatus Pacebacteria bacterium]|nr:ElyC/SanA/YdcF family protein [Candidatus Paceibacterota bacterium]
MKLERLLMNKFVCALVLFFVGVVVVVAINFIVQKGGESFIHDADNVPQKEVALVLGARVYKNGRLSDMFRDRVDMAIGLYEAGKVEKILVSGDHGTKEYDEVNAAKDYLLQNGVPGADIFLDHAGFDTYDSVYRARDVFQVKSMVIVTQGYHLPRALYIADKLGLDAVGVGADLRPYGGESYRNFREEFAVVKAWLDIVLKSKPKFLGEPIPISGEGFASWD